MKVSGWLVALLVIGLIVAGLALAVQGTKEPVERGRSLSDWAEQFGVAYGFGVRPRQLAREEEARLAIRKIGTNGLPTLLSMVRTRDSAINRALVRHLPEFMAERANLHSAERYEEVAICGFLALGGVAKPAIPALIPLLADRDPGVRQRAAHALGAIGPDADEAVPYLVASMNDPQRSDMILTSMEVLTRIRRKPELVVPAMLKFLDPSCTNWNYMSAAIRSVPAFGRDAEAAIPALTRLSQHTNAWVRASALGGLKYIDNERETTNHTTRDNR